MHRMMHRVPDEPVRYSLALLALMEMARLKYFRIAFAF